MGVTELAQAREILRATVSLRDEGHRVLVKLRSVALLLEGQDEDDAPALYGTGVMLSELAEKLCEVLSDLESLIP